ncbi:hypothetical protein [Dysgonomonas alginatilytica]|uniref:hypothetical protein n=1 Tax=Dysgonomonas alginatilytica TaxID=1605892 RepID=UPI0011B5F7F8|nr:hypothetical protein [Dysgonomonas alginatilytica]
MKRTEKNKENNISYFPLSIKWVLTVALLGICVWCVTKTGASPLWMAGIYILLRSILKIIRLSIRIILSLVSLLCLILICMAIVVFIL